MKESSATKSAPPTVAEVATYLQKASRSLGPLNVPPQSHDEALAEFRTMLGRAAELLAESCAEIERVEEVPPTIGHDRHVFAVRVAVLADPRRISCDDLGGIVATGLVRHGLPVVAGYELEVENLTVMRSKESHSGVGTIGFKNKRFPPKGPLPVFVSKAWKKPRESLPIGKH